MANNTSQLAVSVRHANQASTALCETLVTCNSADLLVRDLIQTLRKLSPNLHHLRHSIKIEHEVNLSALEKPLQRWVDICGEVQDDLQDYLSSPDQADFSFNNWNELGYRGGDIYDFRRLLKEYDSIITIALTLQYFDKNSPAKEYLENHEGLALSAAGDLKARQARVFERLETLREQTSAHSEPDTIKLGQAEEEMTSTQECLQLCDQLLRQISQTESTLPHGTSSHELDGSKKDESSDAKITKITNIGNGDSFQVMFTNGKVIDGTNNGRGWFNRHAGGNMRDETMECITKILGNTVPQKMGVDIKDQDLNVSDSGHGADFDRASEFEARYGPGNVSGMKAGEEKAYVGIQLGTEGRKPK